MKTKLFKDPIHGYIEIPADLCKFFIDSLVFQRLRGIEQTSMRVLYPSARHDRFAHSLGVYHLGKLAFNYFIRNISSIIPENDLDEIKKLYNTFIIACLMHDCAHAPFSHTFENHYDKKETGKTKGILDSILVESVNSDEFSKDFPKCRPAPHEKASAITLLKIFNKELNDFCVDNELAARMIIGLKYSQRDNVLKRVSNGLIELLNSKIIDVDKLDYIIRDTWISGVSNFNIDYIRLLSSLTVSIDDESKYSLAYKKNALSVIQNVVDARNYLYRWIYSHHKVVYNNHLLQKSVSELAELLYPDKKDDFYSAAFSLEAFSKPIQINDNNVVYLVNDGDLQHLLKKYLNDLPSAQKLFSRDHLFSVWKNICEYELIFKSKSEDAKINIKKLISEQLDTDVQRQFNISCMTCVVEPPGKINYIGKNLIFIEIENKFISFTDLFPQTEQKLSPEFYYLYINPELVNKLNEIKELIKEYD